MISNQSHHENSTKRQYQTQPSQSGRSHSNAAHSSKAKAKDEYLAFKENLTSTTACPLNVVSSGASRVSSQGSSTQLPIISDNNCQGQERSSTNMKQPKRTSSLSNTGALPADLLYQPHNNCPIATQSQSHRAPTQPTH